MATLTGKTIGELALLTGITSDTLFAVELSGATYHIPYSGLSTGGGSYEEVTYEELYSMYTGSTLTPGGYYLITDFQSIYDQPDFDYDGNPIITGNSKTGITEQLLVFATSVNTLADKVYSLDYPYDGLTYDINFTTTEISNTPAKGRITERIDEFNNRTDYDHRNVFFKRYRLYTYREELRINGTFELQSDGTILGTNTTFSALSVGDIIYTPSTNPNYFEIVNIIDNNNMIVSGDTINPTSGVYFYRTIEETNGSGYFSYKRTNVKSDDYLEYTTFGDAISNEYAKNNYIGNQANNYQNEGNGFLLSNNVFLEGQYESNKFGDYCYNNTWGTDNQNNTWGDFCYNNVSTNDIDDNIIGHYFNNNIINDNLVRNNIGSYFQYNKLFAENDDAFENNTIGNEFRDNIIYSRFYDNNINLRFENNIIGDYGNLTQFRFYRNYIGNYFNSNIIRQDFQNNQILTNFQGNEINGEFVGNNILNGFNYNIIGSYFRVNNIGNAFNNNRINDNFYNNTTKYYFNSNIISNEFFGNNIGEYFTNNQPTNSNLFGWNDLSTISTRTYNSLLISLNNNVGNNILGKELIMKVISTSQYFKIKFNQWTQGGNGGGFQYERTELDSNGNQIGQVIIFTKTNYGNEIDVVVPGVVELSRQSQGGLYNTITDVPPFGGQWPGPGDTEWNSVYTQPNNGERFGYNKIGNYFTNNTIDSDFGYGGSSPQGNVINDFFQNNTIGQYFYNNFIGNYFTNNIVGSDFEQNVIGFEFYNNNIGDTFANNQVGDFFKNNLLGNNLSNNKIGNYFGNNGGNIKNTIFDNFTNNIIGDYFGNDTNFPTTGGGSNNDGGNIINDGFQFNTIGNNVIFNAIDLNFTNNKIGNDFWFNVFGQNNSDNTIGNLFVGNSGIGGFPTAIGNNLISNNLGNYSAFNEIDSDFQYNKIGNFFGNAGSGTQNIISTGFKNNNIGNYFGDNGSQTSGGNVINYEFYDNLIGNEFYSNTIDVEFYRNDIGNEFFNNTLNDSFGGSKFQNNEIGNRFNNNNTNGYFVGNVIGGGFNANNIGNNFNTNEIGFGYNANTIGDNFYNNFIGYYFYNNSIGNNFTQNKILINYFESNTIGNDFRLNIINSRVQSIDFTLATYVYGDYNCEIFSRNDGTLRLSYYDNSDVLNINNINA
jgi:hypothetical protein